MEHSSAFDLAKGVFTLKDPKKIAEALKHSAVASEWRKSDSYMACGCGSVSTLWCI